MTSKRRATMIAFLRNLRGFVYRLLAPFDRIFLKINGLGFYPPLHLRRHVSCLGFIDGSGREYYAYLRLLTGLKDGDRVLDLACGCGLLELALEKEGWTGDLLGVDIHQPSIDWCRRTISRRRPEFRFEHADIFNEAYWRRGKRSLENWLEEFEAREFDCVVAKSLFTHVLPDELEQYLRAISGWLAPGGKALLTFFLLDGIPGDSARRPTELVFHRPTEKANYAVRSFAAPTAAVAYDLEQLSELFDRNGLALVGTPRYGFWSGRSDGLSYQDILIVQKSVSNPEPFRGDPAERSSSRTGRDR